MKNSQNIQTLEVVDDNILVTVQSNKLLSWLTDSKDKSFYVPKAYTISQLKSYLTQRIFSNGRNIKSSYFLIAYGCILNNNQNIESIYQKNKRYIQDSDKGIEIKYTQMQSFG